MPVWRVISRRWASWAGPAWRQPDRLTLYALLPLVRGVVTGLQQVPQDARKARRRWAPGSARQVQLPLAMLRSLRVVSVQTVGMAVVAALIGAGGFGALVFRGC